MTRYRVYYHRGIWQAVVTGRSRNGRGYDLRPIAMAHRLETMWLILANRYNRHGECL